MSAATEALASYIGGMSKWQLRSRLGEAMNTSIFQNRALWPTFSNASAPVRHLAISSLEVDCPKGHWCSNALRTPCGVGSYNPFVDQAEAAACLRCPQDAGPLPGPCL